MTGFDDPAYFGELYADGYDDDERTNLAALPAADFLAELAGPGARALELAIGTGRVALPLAERGVRVEGVEGSDKMAAKMRAKPGGAGVPVVIGDMVDMVDAAGTGVEGPFDMAYLVFNTLFNVADRDRQLTLFRNVARVLAPGGSFVLECFIPDPAHFPWGGHVSVRNVTFDTAGIEVCEHDPSEQKLLYQRVRFTRDGVRLNPLAMRYCWPSELDLMAKLAGMELEARYENWGKKPFTGTSLDQVSVYRLQ